MNTDFTLKLKHHFKTLNTRSRLWLACLMVVLICLADIVLGSAVTLCSLYALPVLFITWYVDTKTGFKIAVLAFIALEITYWANELNGGNLWDWLGYNVFALGILVNQIILFVMTHFLRIKMAELTLWADHDPLTKIFNRRAFMNTLEREFEHMQRYQNPFAIAFLDLDNFKYINDTFGHNEGDALLKVVAHTMKTHCRSSDTVARLGGDEFAVLITEASPEHAAMVLSKMSTAIRDNCKQGNWPVGVSLGSIYFMHLPKDTETAIKMADELMYEVKKSNKNQDKHHVFVIA
jgi:diguanylate cyclase (GGDEF)-like protein